MRSHMCVMLMLAGFCVGVVGACGPSEEPSRGSASTLAAQIECLNVGSEHAAIEFSLMHREFNDLTRIRDVGIEDLDIVDELGRRHALESFGAGPAKGGISIGGRVRCEDNRAREVKVSFELLISLERPGGQAVDGRFRIVLRYSMTPASGLWKLESQQIVRSETKGGD